MKGLKENLKPNSDTKIKENTINLYNINNENKFKNPSILSASNSNKLFAKSKDKCFLNDLEKEILYKKYSKIKWR